MQGCGCLKLAVRRWNGWGFRYEIGDFLIYSGNAILGIIVCEILK